MRQTYVFAVMISLLVLALAAGCAPRQPPDAGDGPQAPGTEDIQGAQTTRQTAEEEERPPEQPPLQPPPGQTQASWQSGGVVIPGNYADAEIVELGNGKYRMYYSIEPEIPGNKLEVFSATSTDGMSWKKEEGVRKEFATFPDVVRLPDGRFRMYFQNRGVIKSAVSGDGLEWEDEPGTRIDAAESGFDIEDVGAQGTIRLDDGTTIMAYRGTIDEPYQAAGKVPNRDTHVYFWATSKDGLAFEKKGLAIESRNEVLLGAADGAEWVRWDDGELRVYFWSYAGVFHAVFRDGVFSEPVFDFTNNENTMAKFPPNPPGDPTLAKINGTWFMYYGQHTQGIYYATFEQQSVQQTPS